MIRNLAGIEVSLCILEVSMKSAEVAKVILLLVSWDVLETVLPPLWYRNVREMLFSYNNCLPDSVICRGWLDQTMQEITKRGYRKRAPFRGNSECIFCHL
jgi:hypothetical protein